VKAHALRLRPQQDLKKELLAWAKTHNIQAASILTCVGSLTQLNIRLAKASVATKREGFFEIVSLVGTFSNSGAHFHIAVADEAGVVTGGHLLDENIIYTTAEIVIAELPEFSFEREVDAETGYLELCVKRVE
jgi:uncharacterized protein